MHHHQTMLLLATVIVSVAIGLTNSAIIVDHDNDVKHHCETKMSKFHAISEFEIFVKELSKLKESTNSKLKSNKDIARCLAEFDSIVELNQIIESGKKDLCDPRFIDELEKFDDIYVLPSRPMWSKLKLAERIDRGPRGYVTRLGIPNEQQAAYAKSNGFMVANVFGKLALHVSFLCHTNMLDNIVRHAEPAFGERQFEIVLGRISKKPEIGDVFYVENVEDLVLGEHRVYYDTNDQTRVAPILADAGKLIQPSSPSKSDQTLPLSPKKKPNKSFNELYNVGIDDYDEGDDMIARLIDKHLKTINSNSNSVKLSPTSMPTSGGQKLAVLLSKKPSGPITPVVSSPKPSNSNNKSQKKMSISEQIKEVTRGPQTRDEWLMAVAENCANFEPYYDSIFVSFIRLAKRGYLAETPTFKRDLEDSPEDQILMTKWLTLTQLCDTFSRVKVLPTMDQDGQPELEWAEVSVMHKPGTHQVISMKNIMPDNMYEKTDIKGMERFLDRVKRLFAKLKRISNIVSKLLTGQLSLNLKKNLQRFDRDTDLDQEAIALEILSQLSFQDTVNQPNSSE